MAGYPIEKIIACFRHAENPGPEPGIGEADRALSRAMSLRHPAAWINFLLTVLRLMPRPDSA